MVRRPLSFMQAALGDEINVPTIGGQAKITIPEGTQNGTVFRMKGKGFPVVNTKNTGDQYVRVNVEIPTKLNKEQKELIRKLDKTMKEKNYTKRVSFFERLKDLGK